jgi:sulfatase maturation enzyme AslB (radical SAM superfamily)
MHRHTDEQGYHKLCCIGDGPQNDLRDEHGERLHVSQRVTDAELLNSPVMKKTRAEMMKHIWPPACFRCEQAEDAGSISGRQHLNERFDNGSYPDLIAATAADGTLENPHVRYADTRLGNVCNLTCRMCGPIASRLWVPHFNGMQPKAYRIPKDELKTLGENNWVKSEPVVWLLEQSLPTVEALHFAGGEPLILPELVDALQACIDSGRAGEIELSFNTNMTVLPDKVTSLWPQFKSVSVLCSIDGFGRTTEYIRRPSKWTEITKNLKKLNDNFDNWKIKWATVSCTTQILNVLNVHELFQYIREAGLDRFTPIPQLMPLFYPDYFSVQVLPAAAKAVARERLKAEIARIEAMNDPRANIAIGSLHATIAFMDEADRTDHLADFLSFSEKSDVVFKDNWREAAPELAPFIDAFPVKKRGLSGLVQLLAG